jgi:hypothetical protein
MAMTALVAGAVLIAINKEGWGLATILSALAVLIGVFVYGRTTSQNGGPPPAAPPSQGDEATDDS